MSQKTNHKNDFFTFFCLKKFKQKNKNTFKVQNKNFKTLIKTLNKKNYYKRKHITQFDKHTV